MNLTEQQIVENWEQLTGKISTTFSGDRLVHLTNLYDTLKDRMMFAPASGIEHFHNCFIGGYVDHVLRVMKCSATLYKTWKDMGADMSGYTIEELAFSALNHDLGKVGDIENDYYVPNASEWHRKNQGKIYNVNPNIQNMTVPHRSLWLLQEFNVKYSQNEMIAIMTHDGLYDDGNAAYLKTWDKDRKLRNHMPLLLHQADHMASMIEFEIWNRGGVNASAPLVKNSAPIFKKKAPKISTANDNAQDLFKDLFGDAS
jgi:hypothetical protein|tara:strand:+ start:1160 stop:1930 length:771 start_codon:yes stop_codon:yes gene_type:complete